MEERIYFHNKPAEASRYFKKAYKALVELDMAEQVLSTAWLGAAQLAMGDWETALKTTERAMKLQKKFSATTITAFGGNSQLEVRWWRYKALMEALKHSPSKAMADEAWQNLDQARVLLLEKVATLSDEGLRRNYFNKVRINREVIKAWLEQAALHHSSSKIAD